jgi:hypothetical protein
MDEKKRKDEIIKTYAALETELVQKGLIDPKTLPVPVSYVHVHVM